MEANDFVTRLKANRTNIEFNNEIHKEYKTILCKLSHKDRGTFSLNVLCIICRNLDKVPTWMDAVDTKDLLNLSIDCVRETRSLNKPEQVKTLACVYHIHKHVVRKSAPTPPELILKLSYMPFEFETNNLLKEYCKTYWNILADRISYIEKIRGKSIHKLLPKINEDILKIIDIYDTVQFCDTVLLFLVKKLHYIYNEGYFEQLNKVYADIFKRIATKDDLKSFKKLPEKESLDLYFKLSDCYYILAENASKSNFKESALNIAVRTGLMLLGHHPSIFHCLQTFYLNSYCSIFENNAYIDTILKNIITSCEMTKKLGYVTAMKVTYPFLYQFLRLFIEYSVNNTNIDNFNENIQADCLILMLHLMNELKDCIQLLKCDNCSVKTGYHDSLRLSFLIKHFITISINNNIDITNLTVLYNNVIKQQYDIMSELKILGCTNYEKCFRKLQTDIHNTAIILNKSKHYAFSIKLINIYLVNELKLSKHEIDLKNVSRALYNKGICELDAKLYEDALIDAFLSLVYGQDLSTDKYMSLVMDVKAKSLKADEDDESSTDLQLMSVVDACKLAIERNLYGDLRPFFNNLKLSTLLKHEYSMYTKLWPSVTPIAGVWRSLNRLANGNNEEWTLVEDQDTVLWTLFDIISETPSVIRTIHNDCFKEMITDLCLKVERIPEPMSADYRVIHTLLLFLKSEYDLNEASVQYGWKVTEPTIDPDAFQAIKTLPQEYKAIEKAIQAVEIWMELVMDLNTVTKLSCLRHSLQLAQIFVQQLLHWGSTVYGLQLAHACCQVAKHIGDKDTYLRNVGVLLYHVDKKVEALQDMTSVAMDYWQELSTQQTGVQTALTFLCDLAIYHSKCGSVGVSARLVQTAQAKLLEAYDRYPDLNLGLALGRLMEAQAMLCQDSGLSALSVVHAIQRHYLSLANTETKWVSRRVQSTTVKYRCGAASASCARLCRALALYRRARSAAGAAMRGGGASGQARLYAHYLNTHYTNDARVKIDNYLKYILGLQATADQPSNILEPKLEPFIPRQELETMLDANIYKKSELSPMCHCAVPRFRLPEYFKHTDCSCHACLNPNTLILCCLTIGLEASMYFRANESEIAENYFNGVKDMFNIYDLKFKHVINMYRKMEFECYIVDCVKRLYEYDFLCVKLEVMIEAAFFEMKLGQVDKADDYIVTIHEMLEDAVNVDRYLRNEVMNLMVTLAKIKKTVVINENSELINEFDSLKLSPVQTVDVINTPISNPTKPLTPSKVIVDDEEIPKKWTMIKLNFDEISPEETESKRNDKKSTKASEFKIPVLVTTKPALEAMTPRVVKPDVIANDKTKPPKLDKNTEFLTPRSTPEQFFTPMTSLKTYPRPLRRDIVKNLEQDFETPKQKDNKKLQVQLQVPSSSRRDKDRMKRATSPGKLEKEATVTRSRRKKPANFNLDDN